MSVRMRHTSGHTKNRRSHHALRAFNILVDPNTKNPRLPHRLDEVTGVYKGIQVVSPKKIAKVDARMQKKLSRKEVSPRQPERLQNSLPVKKSVDPQKSKGIIEKVSKGKAKARSGMGGGV